MNFFSGDTAPPRPEYTYAPLSFLRRYTIPFGLVLGFGLGLGLGAVTAQYQYYIVKETLFGALAGIAAPLFLPLARRLIAALSFVPGDLNHYLTYFVAGACAGVVVWIANSFFPLQRSPLDPAYLLYPVGVAGAMPLIGFIADAVWGQRAERNRTRTIFGQYVSESIAQRVLEAQTNDALTGETRRATVLISDIRGFTRMLQELGAEQVVHTLNDYFTRMIDVIAQYDGTVNKFIGDAIVVLYNAPLTQPDANERAIATARAMQNAVRDMNIQRGQTNLPPLHIGIAIDAGDVVCGNVGSPKRLEYTAIGTPVNTSYQLASLAPADTIYITENVYRALNPRIPATLAQKVELKGGTGTLNVYALDSDFKARLP